LKDAIDFLGRQTAYFQANPVVVPAPAKAQQAPPAVRPAMQALSTLCHALLTSNGFLYAD